MRLFGNLRRVHFIGIGGIGMSGIAEVLLNLGVQVSGSDARLTAVTQRLTGLGARIAEGHAAENLAGADVVVVSSAVPEAKPEIQEARRRGVPVIRRAEMLAELMRVKFNVLVAGSHGKTTTTSMVAHILAHGGLDPTVVIGGRLDTLDSNAKLGGSDLFVAEADESDGSFLLLVPIIAVATNLDHEHVDFYPDLDAVRRAFADFLNRVPFYGAAIVCMDDPGIQSVYPSLKRRVVTYGTLASLDVRADAITLTKEGSSFSVHAFQKDRGAFTLAVPGRHNVLNALAASAAAVEAGATWDMAREALATFRGADRRFQRIGMAEGVEVVDDYAHHPTEVRATLAAARQLGASRIVALFQPHRYTRTAALLGEFGAAFMDADVVLVTDVYPAGEAPIEGATGAALAEEIKRHGHRDARHVAAVEDLAPSITPELRAGDLVLCMGAGSITRVPAQILDRLAGGKR